MNTQQRRLVWPIALIVLAACLSLASGQNSPTPDGAGATGRIKCGTESNSGFKNITISNCVFDYCRGLALEIVDGGLLEDVTVSNITMRDIVNSPIFLRLGSRMRAPEGTPVSALRRVISNAHFQHVKAMHASEALTFSLKNVEDFSIHQVTGLADTRIERVEQKRF
jgi:polygalacturonase